MKKFIGAALLAGTAFTGAALADDGPTFTGTAALTTDYVFRGVSQTNEGPAVQASFDYANGIVYAGVWGSNIDFGLDDGSTEIDLYAGIKPSAGPVTFDLGAIYYMYPNAADDGFELDYVEAKLAASIAPTEALSLTGALFYSPEFTGETGDGLYIEGKAAFAVNEVFGVSAAVGNQSIDESAFIDGSTTTDSYTTWNLGGTVNALGFGLDLRYYDTDIENTFADERVVFTVSKAF